MDEFHNVTIAGLTRRLQLVAIPGGARIAFLNVLGDVELIVSACRAIGRELPPADVILGPETGGIVLAHQLSLETGLPYVIARKKPKPHMGDAIVVAVQTIADQAPQRLMLAEGDRAALVDKRVVLVDEVISTGATLRALEQLVDSARGRVVARAAIATEGERRADVFALCHLPLFAPAETDA